MKKLFIFLCAIAALAACKRIELQETLTPQEVQQDFKVDLTISRADSFAEGPDTRATFKDEWNVGDVVYVFFNGIEAPKYLEMKYTRNGWVATPKNGFSSADLAKSWDEGNWNMTGIFLPYANDYDVASSQGDFYFKDLARNQLVNYEGLYYQEDWAWWRYYDQELHGKLNLSVPAIPESQRVVHFDITGFNEDHVYSLTQEYVKPMVLARLSDMARPLFYCGEKGTVLTGRIDKDRGIVSFSGVLDESAVGKAKDYTFNIVDETTGARFTRTVKGKTISKNLAIGLGSLRDVSVWTAIANPVITLEQTSLEMSGSMQKVPGFLSYTLDYPIAGERLTVTPSASWIKITEIGDDHVSFYAEGNGTGGIRTGTLTLSYKNAESQVFTITQHEWLERYTVIEVAEHEKEVSHEGGSFTLDYSITHPYPDCTITLEYNTANVGHHDWVNGTYANGVISYTVAPNTGTSVRECKLLVRYSGTPNRDTLRIRQFGKPAGPPEIIADFNPDSPETIKGAGEDNVSLIAYVRNPVGGVKMELKPDVSWITNIRQSNEMVYHFTASRNTTGKTRYGNIILTYQDLSVSVPFMQLADEGFIILNPGDMTFNYKKRSVAFDVSLPEGFDYDNLQVEYEHESWFLTNLQRSGSTVSFDMKENNSGEERTSGVIVRYGDAQSVFHVTQTYEAPVLTVSETEIFLNYARQSRAVEVQITNPRENATLYIVEEGDTPWFWSATNSDGIPVFNVSDNTSGDARSTFAIIGYGGISKEVRLHITQSTSHTEMMVNPEYQYIAENPTELTFTVKITDPLSMTEVEATTADQWATVQSVTQTSSTFYDVKVAFSKNRRTTERSTSITFKYGNLSIVSRVTQSRNRDIPEGFVDLGLPSGTLWATRNLGASTEYNIGNFYAWGEITPKSKYLWSNYRFAHGEDDLTKYNDSDHLTALQDADDAAHHANPAWSMPTSDDFNEMDFYTNKQWVTLPVKGVLFTSWDGETSIFLPATGYKDEEGLNEEDCGYYWTKTLYSNLISADYFMVSKEMAGAHWGALGSDFRSDGLAIRPIMKP